MRSLERMLRAKHCLTPASLSPRTRCCCLPPFGQPIVIDCVTQKAMQAHSNDCFFVDLLYDGTHIPDTRDWFPEVHSMLRAAQI